VEAVTNGIHTSTWISRRFQNLFDEYLSPDWRRDPANPEIWKGVYDIPDVDLWAAIESQRSDLVSYVRKRLQRDLVGRTLTRPEFGSANGILDPRVLTIGFARRFATYKRGTLMLSDRERLKHLLFHPETPVQIIIAGKSHPRDDAGKKLIQDLVQFIRNEGARARMVFLEDYDMRVARALVQGVDVWLNNPRRPNEASGTSGMKVVPNGGLNCSVLDGWWDEAYNPRVGWAIGDGTNMGDEGHQDWLDSRALYGLIEHEIAPRFYQRNEAGVPVAWLDMVRASIAELAPVYSTARMVQEYTTRFYVPAAEAHLRLAEDGLARAKDARAWRERVLREWPQLRIESVQSDAARPTRPGSLVNVRARVALGQLKPDDIKVQLMVGRIGTSRELLSPRPVEMAVEEAGEGYAVFQGAISADEPGHWGFSVRIAPFHPDVNVPSELGLVRWEG
jgi:starch phosphorylase